MKLKHMFEFKLGRAAAEKSAASLGDVLVGIEFEFAVPATSPLYAQAREGEVLSLEKIDSIDELKEFFEAEDPRAWDIIQRDYEEWIENRRHNWVDDNWELYAPDDDDLSKREREEIGRESALDVADEHIDGEQKTWVNEEFLNWGRFIRAYDLYPAFGWASDTGNDRSTFYISQNVEADNRTRENVATALSRYLKTTVKTGGSGYRFWKVEHDGSIEGGHSAEIISPPLSWPEAREVVSQVIRFAKDYRLETNNTTGVHFNISTSKMQSFDPVKFVLLLGEQHTLRAFGRENNRFTESQLLSIKKWVDSENLQSLPPADVMKKLREQAHEALLQVKYASVNLKKLEPYGFIEVRIAGGDYLKKLRELLELLDRIVVALHAAVNPEVERNEYLKKLWKLLSSTGPEVSQAADPISALEQFIPYAKTSISDLKMGSLSKPEAVEAVLGLLADLTHELKTKKPLDFKLAAAILKLMKLSGIGVNDVVAAASPSQLQRIKDLRIFASYRF